MREQFAYFPINMRHSQEACCVNEIHVFLFFRFLLAKRSTPGQIMSTVMADHCGLMTLSVVRSVFVFENRFTDEG